MNIANNKTTEKEINWSDVLWDLLEQWKAVLITALVVMILVAGTKYIRDVKAYKADQEDKDVMKTASIEEQTDRILDKLPENERAAVMAAVNQNGMIISEMDYLNNSVLMKTDPTNQRMLVMDYYISTDEQSESLKAALIYAYTAYLNGDRAVRTLKDAIDPKLENNYIAELISVNEVDPAERKEAYGASLEIQIVLPENSDCEKIEKVVSGLINDCFIELSDKIGPHNIVLLKEEELYRCNMEAVRKRYFILQSIENMQGSIKNMQSRMSDEQKTAFEAVNALYSESPTADDEVVEDKARKTEKPAISKKYAFFGLLLGVMLYACFFTVGYIIKKHINSASDAEYYTRSRLLGEVYHQIEHRGINALLHSKLVDRFRYGDRLDEDAQIQKAASKLDTACRHAGIDTVSLLCMSELTDVKKKIVESIRKQGLNVHVTEVQKQTDDNYLLSIKDVVLIVEDDIKVNDVMTLTAQLEDYGVNLLGDIFYKSV